MEVFNKPKPFDVHGDPASLELCWSRWLKDFELFLVAADITADLRKKAALLNLAGEEVQNVYHSLPPDEVGTDYGHLLAALNKHFKPQLNPLYEVYKFRNTKQEATETFKEFYIRLRGLSANCEFETKLDRELLIQILVGTSSSKLRKQILKNAAITLKDVIALGESEELVTSQSHSFENSGSQQLDVNKVTSKSRHTKSAQDGKTEKSCYSCGGKWPHSSGCPAKGTQCSICEKFNHYPSMCRAKKTGKDEKNESSQKKARKSKVNQVKAPSENGSGSDSSDSDVTLNVREETSSLPTVKAEMLGRKIKLIVDTGSSVNLINRFQYFKLKNPPPLQPHNSLLFGYQDGQVNTVGQFTSTITYNGCSSVGKFIVTEGGEAILGNKTAQALGIVKLTLYLAEGSSVPRIDSEFVERKFPNIFKGIGKLKNFQVELHVDPEVPPVAVGYRRVPFHLRKFMEAEINQLLDKDIIERAEGPTPWVSPALLVPKSGGTGYRLCVDMRAANKATKRERHPVPTVDEVFALITGSQFYSKIDLAKGFHQLELDEGSRAITTFSTHMGLFRYKRLSFGINSAPEKFHSVVKAAIGGLENVVNVSDDILIFAKTEQEHSESFSMC